MDVRYWLMPENVKMLKKEGWRVSAPGEESISSPDVYLHPQGGLLYFDLDDLSPVIVPPNVVLRITIKIQLYENFILEGTYQMRGAELTVTTKRLTDKQGRKYQVVSIVASSLKGAKKLYELVRQGKLDKVEVELWKSLEAEDVQKKSLLRRFLFYLFSR